MSSKSEKIKKRIMKDELEMQHFGFSSSDFISQLQITFHLRIDEALRDLDKAISVKYNLDEESKKKLQTELINTAGWSKNIVNEKFNSNEFQEKIKSFISIPDNIVLSDDLIHNEKFDSTVESLTKEIEDLEKEYKKQKLLCNIYDQELNIYHKLAPLEEPFKRICHEVNNWERIAHLKQIANVESTKFSYLNDLIKQKSDIDYNFIFDYDDFNDKCIVEE